jgi:hypothetical protein
MSCPRLHVPPIMVAIGRQDLTTCQPALSLLSARDVLGLPAASPEGFQYWVGTTRVGTSGSDDI